MSSATTRSATRSSDKPFSLVIFGATGFTGQLITSRLLQNEEVSAKKLKILLAGRSDTKLKQLVKGDEKNAHLVDFCVASVDDDESLDKMTSQSKVILNCVGPFSKYGEAVVQSCLRNHCHYLDITGEPAYIQTLISKYDEVARLKKICLVCSCGFDSIPADIGVFNVLKQVSLFNDLDDDKNTGFVAVNGYLKLNMPGLISYGTYHTVVTSLDNLSLFGSGKNTKQQKTNENKKPKKKSILKRGIRWEPSVNSYVVPFSTSDPTIVKRSAEVLGYMNDGAIPFEYGHYLQIQKWYNILLLLVVMLLLLLVTRFSWGAKLLLKLWRQPGEGPSEEDRKKSSCELTFEGIATHEKTIQKVTGACVIAGDPGYDETAHMALQSALLMNELYGEEGVNESERRYGVLTPAPVFGQQIVDRLHDNSKVRFIVKENKIIKNTDPSYVEVRPEVERLTNIKNFE